MANCKLITGPMFAGKTTRLFDICKKHAIYEKCIIVRPEKDTRISGEGMLFTHSKGDISTINSNIDTITIPDASYSLPIGISEKYSVIAIDEGQFFTNLYTIVLGLVSANPPVNVIVAALNSQHDMTQWDPLSETLPFFNEIEFICSVCHECKQNNASTSKMIVGEDKGFIGGADKYIALCNKCRFADNKIQN